MQRKDPGLLKRVVDDENDGYIKQKMVAKLYMYLFKMIIR